MVNIPRLQYYLSDAEKESAGMDVLEISRGLTLRCVATGHFFMLISVFKPMLGFRSVRTQNGEGCTVEYDTDEQSSLALCRQDRYFGAGNRADGGFLSDATMIYIVWNNAIGLAYACVDGNAISKTFKYLREPAEWPEEEVEAALGTDEVRAQVPYL